MAKQRDVIDAQGKRPAWMVDPKVYAQVFAGTKGGQAILDELAVRFYDRTSVVPGDPWATHVKEGERNVVKFIIDMCAEAQKGK